jgi:hypothetical protein
VTALAMRRLFGRYVDLPPQAARPSGAPAISAT